MSQVRNDGGLHWRAVVKADAGYILKLSQQDFLIDWRWELRERGVWNDTQVFGLSIWKNGIAIY